MTPALKRSPTRVLIIDDDPLTRALLVSTLKNHCHLSVAAEGAEGFAKALEQVPDVAVIDVNMPGWNGLKTLDAFQSHPRLKDVKVVMLTADSSKQTVIAATRGGANDYLIKTSFCKREFYKKLNQLIPGTIEDPSADDLEEGGDPASGDASGAMPLPVGISIGRSRPPEACGEVVTAHTSQPLFALPADEAADSKLQSIIDGWE